MSKKPPLIVRLYVGIPACGKSTAAKKLVAESNGQWVRVNKDDLRSMLLGGKWSKERESLIEMTRDQIILSALSEGKNVVVDDTNLAPRHKRHITNMVNVSNILHHAVVEEEWFMDSLDYELCMKRNISRSAVVPPNVMEDMYRSFMKRYVEEKL